MPKKAEEAVAEKVFEAPKGSQVYRGKASADGADDPYAGVNPNPNPNPNRGKACADGDDDPYAGD